MFGFAVSEFHALTLDCFEETGTGNTPEVSVQPIVQGNCLFSVMEVREVVNCATRKKIFFNLQSTPSLPQSMNTPTPIPPQSMNTAPHPHPSP